MTAVMPSIWSSSATRFSISAIWPRILVICEDTDVKCVFISTTTPEMRLICALRVSRSTRIEMEIAPRMMIPAWML